MAGLLVRSYYTTNTSLRLFTQIPSYSHFNNTVLKRFRSGRFKVSPHFGYNSEKGKHFCVQSCSISSSSISSAEEIGAKESESESESSSSSSSAWLVEDDANLDVNDDGGGERNNENEYLVKDFGWKVRRLANNIEEIRNVAWIQAQAFHVPTLFFDDYFFKFFQGEVLAGLIYKLKNSPPNRYACLVAEPETSDLTQTEEKEQILVGVVDATALRDQNVLQYFPPDADEYLYISGIAVSETFRRKKIATVLLKACDTLSISWGFKYLVLRAYEDDHGARKLYSNAGYRVVSGDPPWFTTWIGRKRRVLMIKYPNESSHRDSYKMN